MKKKVIIATWLGNFSLNYGSVLQSVAMQKIMRDKGFEPITINHEFSYDTSFLKKSKRFFDTLWTRSVRYNLTKLKIWCFIKQNMKISPRCYCDQDVVSYVKRKEPDILLCGSDVIWKQLWIRPFFLWDYDELKDYPVFAYAPSIQKGTVKYDMEVALKRFQGISGRETEVKDILQKYTKNEIAVVLDPTLTVTPEFWNERATKRLIKESYILCYILSEAQVHTVAIKNIQKQVKAQRVVYVYTDCIDKNENDCYTDYEGNEYGKVTGPKQFLSLIKYASAVCTDSFHGTAISIAFHKEFYVFGRNRLWELKEDYRIKDLFRRLQIPDRFVEKMKDIERMQSIDWSETEKCLEVEREKSLQYITDVINKIEGR